jgi:hypothetical protein
MKLIAYQKGADRMMARVQGNEVLPFARLEELTRPEADTLSPTHKGPPSRQSHSNQGETYGKNR